LPAIIGRGTAREIQLLDRLAMLRPARPAAPPAPETASALGLKVRELDAANAERVGLEPGEGVLVVDVEAESAAAERRIRGARRTHPDLPAQRTHGNSWAVCDLHLARLRRL
jgi:hypothetical protein